MQADAINSSGLFPNLTFKDTKDSNVDTNGLKSRPDITAFVTSELAQIPSLIPKNELGQYMHHAALVIERKRADEDPFLPAPKDKTDVEKTADFAKRVRGQLITYATNFHSARPRVFSFQLLLIGQKARMLRWDRTGAVVSDLFDWMKGPTLYMFISRFYDASGFQRGLDTTARPAEGDEIAAACAAFETAGFQNSKATQPPFYVYEVLCSPEDAPVRQTRSFLAGRPVTHSHTFTGRATAGYICYDLATKGVHFMKDAWRLLGQDALMSEADVYGILNEVLPVTPGHPDDGEEDFFLKEDKEGSPKESDAGPASISPAVPPEGSPVEKAAVPHVATLLCGGDVFVNDVSQKTIDHHTLSPEYHLPQPPVGAPAPQAGRNSRPMRHYVHSRLVLKEVGSLLAEFKTVGDLLQVLLDVVHGEQSPSDLFAATGP